MHKKSGFTLIEVLVVIVIVGILSIIAYPLTLGQKERSEVVELQGSSSSHWRKMAAECTTNENFDDCRSILDASLYSGANSKRMTVYLDVFPRSGIGLLSNSNFRIFGSNDSRGTSNEVYTEVGGSYDFTPSGSGGGYFTIDSNDFTGGEKYSLVFDLTQTSGGIWARTYLDGMNKLNTVIPGTLDHSNQSLTMGQWNNGIETQSLDGRFDIRGILME